MQTGQQRPIEVLRQLAAIRTVVRRRLGVFGVCTVLAGGCLSLLTIIALDWTLELPPALRIFGAALFVVGFGMAALHWIVKPLQTRLSLAQVAGRLEQHFGGLDDRLSSTVSFLTSPDRASGSLMRQVIANTDQVVSELPLREALTLRPVLVRLCLLVASVGVLATIVVTSQEWFSIGVGRYVRPFGATEWPHRVDVLPLTGDLTVPIGESITLRMRVRRGWETHLRGVVHWIDEEDEKTTLAMHYQGDGQYRCTVDGVSRGAVYWFEAGDDSTRRSASRITVVHRPEVAWIVAEISPPGYAGNAQRVAYDLSAGAASAVPGSRAEIVIRPTKPVRHVSDGTPAAWLVLETGDSDERRLPLRPASDPSQDLAASWTVEGDATFRVALMDRDGFSNREPVVYSIVTAADRPPTVILTEPKAMSEVPPRGTLKMRVRAEDDFGIAALGLMGRVTGEDRTFEIPLLQDAKPRTSTSGVAVAVDRVWDIASLDLTPPATIVYTVEATDNRVFGDSIGQVGSSGTMRVKVVSEAAFASRMRETLVALEGRIRRTLFQQQAIRDECIDLREGGSGEHALTATEQDALMNLIRRQRGVAETLAEMSRRFERLAGTIQRNGRDDEASLKLVRRTQRELADVADHPMTEAALALQKGANAATHDDRVLRLDDATARQESVARRLRDLVRRMDVWGDYRALVNKTRDLMDRQQRLRGHTAATGQLTLGKRPVELTARQRATLRQLQHRQRQLGAEVDTLLQRLRSASEAKTSSGTAQTASIESALRAAVAGEVFDRMRRAAVAIGENRLAGASNEQHRASRALAKMLTGLEGQEVRRLAELAKRLERADQAVAELLAQQEALANETREAVTIEATREVFFDQSSDQTQLRRNADALGRDFSESDDTADAGEKVREAARAMHKAARSLVDGQGGGAIESQADSIERLRGAMEMLAEQMRRAALAASQKMMAAARARLEEIRDDQASINNATSEVAAVVATRGRLDRRSARRVGKLASEQAAARQSTDSVREELGRTGVYDRVLRRVADEMGRAGDSLRGRRIDDDLVRVQGRIARRLEQLIRALRDAEQLPPSDDFVDAISGGGQGEGHAQPGIPAAAELIMLRTMQAELLAETVELGASIGTPSEADLRAAESLGHQQREVRELMALIVRNAREER